MQDEVPEQLGQLLDDLELGVYLMRAGECLFLSAELRDLVGAGVTSDAGSSGDPVVSGCHPDDRAPLEDALAELVASGKPFAMTVRFGAADTSSRTARGRWAAWPRGGQVVVVGTVVAESAESRLDQERIEKLSHDLRTPLNAVLGYAQLLGLHDLPADQQSSVDQVMAGGRRLLGVIEGLEQG